MRIRMIGLLLLAGLTSMPAAAQKKAAPKPKATPTPSPAMTPSPEAPTMSAACTAPQYRQFDFWLGDWDLLGADGKKSAEDKVVQVLSGCALQENANSVEGVQRLSVSAYDPATHHWHQTLMDDGGAILHLEGEFADGKMILVGQRPSQKEKGVTVTHRIAWTPLPDHRVRRYWEFSNNGGRSWRPFFDGTYVPRK